jgi:regulatory protein
VTDEEVVATAIRNAMDMLSRREHSVEELRRKLTAKGFDDDVVTNVVDDLEARNLVSDERFVETFVRSRINRGQGPVRIAQDLQERGVDDLLIEQSIHYDNDYWSESIDRVRAKKFGAPKKLSRQEWAKQARFLQQRGFTTEQIREALNKRDHSE